MCAAADMLHESYINLAPPFRLYAQPARRIGIYTLVYAQCVSAF